VVFPQLRLLLPYVMPELCTAWLILSNGSVLLLKIVREIFRLNLLFQVGWGRARKNRRVDVSGRVGEVENLPLFLPTAVGTPTKAHMDSQFKHNEREKLEKILSTPVNPGPSLQDTSNLFYPSKVQYFAQ